MKKRYFFLIIYWLFLVSCQGNNDQKEQHISGVALGTTYHITFFSAKEFPAQEGIDSVFEAVNHSFSTYVSTSDISKINKGDTSIVVDHMFQDVFRLSQKIYTKTDGYFDPTVGNLVNAYGFGSEKLKTLDDPHTIDSLMQFVGLNKLRITSAGKIKKELPGVYLEFNAIGKGYAVDRVGVYLEQHDIKNYLVEVGGELRFQGKNITKKKPWRVGIDNPKQKDDDPEISTIIELKKGGMATSGNYRKFRIDTATGKKYVHTINPLTGETEKSRLISASVLAENCAMADGYATAFMAMGYKKARKKVKELDGIEVFFIYDDHGVSKSYATSGFKKHIFSNTD